MTKADLRTEVFRRLREVSGGSLAFSTTDVDTAVNAGYAELSDQTEWNERSITVDLETDRPFYDLRTLIGPEVLAPGPSFNVDTNRWLVPTMTRELDAYDRRWEVATDMPFRVLVQGLWWLGYWPRVQSDTGTVVQYYTALPTALTDDLDEPGFPDTFHYAIVEFALSDLWAQDAETMRAQAAWTAYLSGEAALQQWVDQRAGSAMRRGAGGLDSLAAYQ